jgi:hypothetical protein
MATTKTEIRVTGNTRPHRDALKAAGYRWEPAAKYWTKTVDVAVPEYRADNKPERVAVVGGVCWPDVEIKVAEIGRCFSLYFRGLNVPTAERGAPAKPDYSDPTNRGLNGQFVHGMTLIAGSAPDDFE